MRRSKGLPRRQQRLRENRRPARHLRPESGLEQSEAPAFAVTLPLAALVQAVGAALPQLDPVGGETEARPVRGTRDGAAVKARGDLGEAPRTEMRRLAALLVAGGAEAVIAGCTEVPLLLSAQDVSVPLVDSAEVLAAACVARCG